MISVSIVAVIRRVEERRRDGRQTPFVYVHGGWALTNRVGHSSSGLHDLLFHPVSGTLLSRYNDARGELHLPLFSEELGMKLQRVDKRRRSRDLGG